VSTYLGAGVGINSKVWVGLKKSNQIKKKNQHFKSNKIRTKIKINWF
jgi:hypothetical protein